MEKTVNTPKEANFKVETFNFNYNLESGFFDFEFKGSVTFNAIISFIATIGAAASSFVKNNPQTDIVKPRFKRLKVKQKDIEQYMSEAFLQGIKVSELYEKHRNIHFPDTPDNMKTYEHFFNEHHLFEDLLEWLKLREEEEID